MVSRPLLRRRRPLIEDDTRPLEKAQAATNSAWGEIRKAAESLGGVVKEGLKLARKDAIKQGAREGEQAVSRDENGDLQVAFRDDGFLTPVWDEAYNQAAEAAYVAEVSNDIRTQIGRLRGEHQADPAGFRAATDGYVKELAAGSPLRVRSAVRAKAQAEQRRALLNVMTEARTTANTKHRGALIAEKRASEADIINLARQNGQDTQEYKFALAEFEDIQATLVANPMFGMSQEEADADTANLVARATLAAGESQVMEIYEKSGELAAIQAARKMAGRTDLLLTESDRPQFVTRMKTQINEREADKASRRARIDATFTQKIKDAGTEALMTGDWRKSLDETAIFEAYPPDRYPGRAAEVVRDLDMNATVYHATKALERSTPAEDAALIEEYRQSGLTSERDQAVYVKVQEALIAKRKALEKDSAAYLALAAPEFNDRLESAIRGLSDLPDDATEEDVRQARAEVAGVISDQLTEIRRLGGVPRILSKTQAKAAVATVLGEPEDEMRGSNMVQAIREMDTLYGEHFPRVLGELVDAGLPAEAEGVALAKNDPLVAARMARAAAQGHKALRQSVRDTVLTQPGSTMDEFERRIAESLQPMMDTLRHNDRPAEDITRAQRMAETYAFQIAVETGTADGTVARQAADDLFKYEFRDTFRVPDTFDAGRVDAASRDILRGLTADMLVPPQSSDPRLSEEARAQGYLRHVRQFGIWVTNQDDTGLVLYDGYGEPVMMREVDDVRSVSFRFDDDIVVERTSSRVAGDLPSGPFDLTPKELEDMGITRDTGFNRSSSVASIERADPTTGKPPRAETVSPAESNVSAAADLVKKFEGISLIPYDDAGEIRIGFGSDTITKADGSVVKVDKGARITRADAERDLERRLSAEFIPRARKAAGARWERLSENQQAVLVSLAYNFGDVPGSVKRVLSGSSIAAIAKAIRGLTPGSGVPKKYHAGLKRRRREEARIFEAS